MALAQDRAPPAPALGIERPHLIPELSPLPPSSTVPTQTMTEEQLQSQPRMLEFFLDSAIDRETWVDVAHFLPLYEKTENPNRTLIDFARAGLANHRGNFDEAIRLYRHLLYQFAFNIIETIINADF